MLAGYIPEPGRIELVDAPEPTLDGPPLEEGAGDIIFQPQLGCLCGSDLPFFDGPGEWGPFPQKIGHSLHEMVGVVTETTGQRFRPGDRVLAVPIDQLGLFERFRLSENRAVPLDDRKPPDQALLAQPLGTVIYALKKIPHLLDCDAAVVGQGPIGQLFNAALRKLGARRVIGIDPLASRLERSPQMGATHTVCNADEDPREAIARINGGRLPGLVIEAVGHQDQALNLCIDLCGPRGRLLYFGVPPEQIDGIRWRDLVFKQLTVHTSINPDFSRDFPLAMEWISSGQLDVTPLITHRFPLAEIQKAFETFRDRKDGALKVLVDFPAGG